MIITIIIIIIIIVTIIITITATINCELCNKYGFLEAEKWYDHRTEK